MNSKVRDGTLKKESNLFRALSEIMVTNAEEAAKLAEELCEIKLMVFRKQTQISEGTQVSEGIDSFLQIKVTDTISRLKKSHKQTYFTYRTYTEDVLKSRKQTDKQKHESNARFNLVDTSRSHKERSHDSYSDKIDPEFRNSIYQNIVY